FTGIGRLQPNVDILIQDEYKEHYVDVLLALGISPKQVCFVQPLDGGLGKEHDDMEDVIEFLKPKVILNRKSIPDHPTGFMRAIKSLPKILSDHGVKYQPFEVGSHPWAKE